VLNRQTEALVRCTSNKPIIYRLSCDHVNVVGYVRDRRVGGGQIQSSKSSPYTTEGVPYPLPFSGRTQFKEEPDLAENLYSRVMRGFIVLRIPGRSSEQARHYLVSEQAPLEARRPS